MNFTRLFCKFLYFHIFIEICQGYQKYKLESYKLCASKPFKKVYDILNPPELVLESDEDAAVILSQTWNSTNVSRLRSSCSFSVKSSKPRSKFFIVITKLKFRRTKDFCYDFIQFKYGGKKSEKICDEIGTQQGQAQPIFGQRIDSFRVEVNVDKHIAANDVLEFEMIITAAHECLSSDDFKCDETDSFSCISKRFVTDGVMNCFPPCIDEGGCFSETTSAEVADASSVVLSAITSLVFTMVAVVACTWVCWRYRQCRRRSNDAQNAADEPDIELPQTSQGVDQSTNNHSEPLPRPPSSPQDLPPSYESLFPNK